jgi:hypothetical protein
MTVSSEGDPADLPPSSTRDLAATFTPLFAELRRLLSKRVRPGMYIEVPAAPHQGNSWVGELRDERLLHCTTFVMIVEVEGDLVVASNEIPDITKIASWRRIAAIVRLQGARRADPRDLPPAPGGPDPAQPGLLPHRYQRPAVAGAGRRPQGRLLPAPPYDPQRARVRLVAIPRKEP